MPIPASQVSPVAEEALNGMGICVIRLPMPRAQLPRGIDPDLLVSQVRNTMPYLFEDPAFAEDFPPAGVLRERAAAPVGELTHFEYFRLCVSSHYLTCATPVPTDVDNQIRHKLWPAALPVGTALEMADLVLASRGWNFPQVTARFVHGAPGTPRSGDALTGHLGEWFTIAAAAYCALGQYPDPEASAKRQEALAAIADEVDRHAELFATLWRAGDGIACLKASANIAHNLGDLDRVMDMWSLGVGDPLRLRFYKLGASPFDSDRKLRYLGRLWTAGELYKSTIVESSMALENHRHFALRKPKCLRRARSLLIPIGPFFDDWGRQVARAFQGPDGRPSEDTLEVVEALLHGRDRLPRTEGYGRALRGIFEVHPELRAGKADVDASAKGQELRRILDLPQDRFEKRWHEGALRQLEEIPSRAG